MAKELDSLPLKDSKGGEGALKELSAKVKKYTEEI